MNLPLWLAMLLSVVIYSIPMLWLFSKNDDKHFELRIFGLVLWWIGMPTVLFLIHCLAGIPIT